MAVLAVSVGHASVIEDASQPSPVSTNIPTSTDQHDAVETEKRRKWGVENVRFRMSYVQQDGRGYQSQAGPAQGPGRETLKVWQPIAGITFHSSSKWRHDMNLAVDILTAASPDALDAISKASRDNEAATLLVNSSVAQEKGQRWSIRYGVHMEEHWRTGIGGIGYQIGFDRDATVLSASVMGIYDSFDRVMPDGDNDDIRDRGTVSLNAAVAQVLSPTTIADINYGYTFQTGELETTWNSVPLSFAPGQMPDEVTNVYQVRTFERLPEQRHRHAAMARLAQHIPWSRSTIQLHYRWYQDSFGLRAHTAQGYVYQYVVRADAIKVYVRGGYRWYQQTGVDFWRSSTPATTPLQQSVTADSDLAPFQAWTASGQLSFRWAARRKTREHMSDLTYYRYQRSNHLHADIFSLGYGIIF